MSAVLLVNPRSGSGRAAVVARAVLDALHECGVECQARHVGAPGGPDAASLRGARALIVVGGDGTVNRAAALAADAAVPLAIVPTGTENLAAREFGFRADPVALAQAVARGHTRHVDLGTVAGQPFLVMTSAGFDSAVVQAVHRARRGPITRWNYLWPCLSLAVRWRAPQIRVTVDESVVFEGHGQLVVANCRHYGGGLHPARAADASDGMLDAVVLPARGGMDIVRWMGKLRSHDWNGHGAHLARGQRVRLESTPAVPFQVDGDPADWAAVGTVEIAIRPRALALIASAP